MSSFEFRGPAVDGLYDPHHFQNRAGNLRRFFFSSNSPGGMRIAESGDFELRYPGLCPHDRMGRAVGHDGTVGLNAVGQEMMRPRSFATVGAGLVRTHRSPGDFTGYSSKNQVALKGNATFAYRLSRHHERGES